MNIHLFQSTSLQKMEPIALHELKNERCARISGDDFLDLLDLNRTKFQKPKILAIDVRNSEEYVLYQLTTDNFCL